MRIKFDVSIIIVSYNTRDLTINCLESVIEHTKDINYDIYVIDNASTDGSQLMIKEKFPGVNLVENIKNIGFGSANNIGIRASEAKYVFFLNSDTRLLNNVVKIFYDFMEDPANKNWACCGGNLYNEDMTPQYSFGNFPSIWKIFFEFGLNRILKKYYQEHISIEAKNYIENIRKVDYIIGADMFVRKDVLDKIGLFDEDFFIYYEDVELSHRMFKEGYKIMLLPSAKIIHLCGKSSTGIPLTQKIEFIERSKYLYFKKCYGNYTSLLVRIIYLINYTIWFLVRRNAISFEFIKFTLKG